MKLTPLSELAGHSMYLEANFAKGPDNGGGGKKKKGKKEEEEEGEQGTHQDTAAARRKFSTGTHTDTRGQTDKEFYNWNSWLQGFKILFSC